MQALDQIISLNKINKTYNKTNILEDVSFIIVKNSITAFIGNNGAGKTTSIKIIFREIKPDSGTIEFCKKNLVTMFFPDSNNIPLNMTINEYVNLELLLKNIDIKNNKKYIEDVFKKLDLWKERNKKLKNLSAGQKKKALMIPVLIIIPDLLVLDEPTANLDVDAKKDFIKIIKKLNSIGVTILVTSHILEELNEIATHCLLINQGKIIWSGEFDKNSTNINKIYNHFINKQEINLDFLDERVKNAKTVNNL